MSSENSATDEQASGQLFGWLEMLLVAAIALLLYLPAISAPFVFDDLLVIQDNEIVHEGDLGTILSTGYWDGYDEALGDRATLYRPLTILSYAWNWAASGDDPVGFRWVNILLHMFTSVTVLVLLRRILCSRIGALAGGLLFAAHPIHTEAVTYIAGRADLLTALFFFGAWLAYSLVLPRKNLGRWLLYAVSLALFFVSLLAKEMSATLPAVLILFDGIARLREGDSFKAALKALLRRWHLYAGYFAVLALFVFVRISVLGALVPDSNDIHLHANPLRDLSALERVDDAANLLGREIGLLVFPATLTIDYSFGAIPVSEGLVGGSSLAWALLAVALFLGAFGALLARRYFMFAAATLFFFGTLFPVSNLAFIIGTNLGERVLYLVSFAVCLAFGALVQTYASKKKPLVWGLIALTTILASWRTASRNGDYESEYRLFEAATEAYPGSVRAQYNLGVLAYERSVEMERAREGQAAQAELAKALAAYERAVAIDPTYIEARYEVARIAQQRGDASTASREFQAILETGQFSVMPPDTLTAFADSCLARGEAERARRVLLQLGDRPESMRFAYLLALGLLESALENDSAAKQHFQRVLALPIPDDDALRMQRVRVSVELARIHGRLGDDASAEALFEEAIGSDVASLGPHLYLIQFLRDRGRYEQASRAIARAEAASPKHYLVSAERGELARVQGDFGAALQHFTTALSAQPLHGASRQGLVAIGKKLLATTVTERLSSAEAQRNLLMAEVALRAAIERQVRTPGLHVDYNTILMRLGRWRAAAQGFEQIASRNGQRAEEVKLLAAECLQALGESALALRSEVQAGDAAVRALALTSAKDALALTRPGDLAYVRALEALVQLHTLNGDQGEAEKVRADLRIWAPNRK
ncbi:MAG: tetratricopeptide (TPR) repeat protein [Planctomycetota bacterium]|jgi:tetratricopeptide (TPR) repeat protein